MTDEKRKEVLELLLKDDKPTELIVQYCPQYLYKYRSGNSRDLDALERDTIWIGNATRMDDPYDSMQMLTDEFKAKMLSAIFCEKKFNNEKYWRHLEPDSIQKGCFICSFSEVNNNQDMWDRYANKEQGICIEYRTEDLFRNVGMPLLPVYYEEKKSDDEEVLSKLSSAALMYRNFLIKDKEGKNGEDWYSQREWRIIARHNILGIEESDEGKCIAVPKPTKIILGKNSSDDLKRRIAAWKEKEENKDVSIVEKK